MLDSRSRWCRPFAAWLLALALAACARRGASLPSAGAKPAASAIAASQPAPLAAPALDFVPPAPWRSRKPGSSAIDPPDLARETWRVLVTQNRPLQRKTPIWQALPAEHSVELQMPLASRFQCVAAPLRVTPDMNTWQTTLKAWLLTRTLLCSSDGWHSWTESTHRVRQPIGVTRDPERGTAMLLRERDEHDAVRETVVLMLADAERREAATGPPRIVSSGPMDLD